MDDFRMLGQPKRRKGISMDDVPCRAGGATEFFVVNLVPPHEEKMRRSKKMKKTS